MMRLILFVAMLIQIGTVSIASPQSGETLEGGVQILGSMDVPNFSSAELAFSYATGSTDSADSWFTIQIFSQPRLESPLAVWDTASVTDGEYKLRLRVHLQDGSVQDIVVNGLKIRNAAAQPAATLDDFSQPAGPQASATPRATPLPLALLKPTPDAVNPASLNVAGIVSTFRGGALTALSLLILVAFLLRHRKE